MKQVQDAIRARYSLDGACHALSGRALEQFIWAWTFSASRFSGIPGMVQDAYCDRHGDTHYRKRMEQVRRIAARIVADKAACNG